MQYFVYKIKKKIPIYGKGDQVRDWLFVEDHCEAIEKVFKSGKRDETYLVGGKNEMTNIDLIKNLIEIYFKIKKPNLKGNRIYGKDRHNI